MQRGQRLCQSARLVRYMERLTYHIRPRQRQMIGADRRRYPSADSVEK